MLSIGKKILCAPATTTDIGTNTMSKNDDETAREKFEKRMESFEEYMDANAQAAENVGYSVQARMEALESEYGDTFRVRPRVAIAVDAAIGVACWIMVFVIGIPLWLSIPVFILMVVTFYSLGKSIAGLVA